MRKLWIVPLFLLAGIGVNGQETETINDFNGSVDYGNSTHLSVKEVEIYGDYVPASGVTTAYKATMLTVENNTGYPLSDICWSFTLPLKDGDNETATWRVGDLEFEIPAIECDDVGRYDVNADDCIKAIVNFTAHSNGVEVGDTYTVLLDVKPYIERVDIIRKEDNTPNDTYNVYYIVEFYGAKEVQIKMRESGRPILRSQFATGPVIANVVTRSITKFYKAWLEISVRNRYGSDEYTVELPPFIGDDVTSLSTPTGDIEGLADSAISFIEVSDMAGIRIKSVSAISQLKTLKNGIYIVTVYDNDGNANQYKYLKK